jgi:glycine cleavage system H protein
MPESLTFLMGKFPALLPGDLHYARNHMWWRRLENGFMRFGFSAYAVRLMQDVYFLDWQVSVGDMLQLRQTIGHIETSKAQSDLFAPAAGRLLGFNQELLQDPSAINVDNYGAGWLLEMESDGAGTMTPAEYHKFLDDNWETTQRLLKGHM